LTDYIFETALEKTETPEERTLLLQTITKNTTALFDQDSEWTAHILISALKKTETQEERASLLQAVVDTTKDLFKQNLSNMFHIVAENTAHLLMNVLKKIETEEESKLTLQAINEGNMAAWVKECPVRANIILKTALEKADSIEFERLMNHIHLFFRASTEGNHYETDYSTAPIAELAFQKATERKIECAPYKNGYLCRTFAVSGKSEKTGNVHALIFPDPEEIGGCIFLRHLSIKTEKELSEDIKKTSRYASGYPSRMNDYGHLSNINDIAQEMKRRWNSQVVPS
jgi:hypothetical protein